MIVAENITKYFGQFCALQDVSFKIAQGEIVGFLGQNGAGKTTLMRILTSFLPASSGKLTIFDSKINKNSLAIRKKIGYLPENPPLYFNMTVRDYLKFAAKMKDIAPKLYKAQVERVIEACGLGDVENKVIRALSKGFKQRVGIAQAIINEPDLLILDEPTNGLDPVQKLAVRKLIKSLEFKRTVIISTHIMSEIEQIAQRVVILKSGKIIKDNSLNNLLTDQKKYIKIFMRLQGTKPAIINAIKATNNLKLSEINFSDDVFFVQLALTNPLSNYNELIKNILDADCRIMELKEYKSNLESVFLRVNA